MGLNDQGIGQHPKHHVEVFHVVGGLEHPIPPGSLPMQQFQRGEQVLVAPGVILPLQPLGIARHIHHRFRRLAHERKVEQEYVFLRSVKFDGMDDGKLRRQEPHRFLSQFGRPLPAVWIVKRLAAQRQWAQCFPGSQFPHVGIGGNQSVQGGRRGALQAGDDDDSARIQVEDPGVFPDQVLRAKPSRESRYDPRPLYRSTHRRKPCFLVDGLDKHRQGFKEPVVTEVIQTGLSLCRGDYPVDIEVATEADLPGQAARPIEDGNRQRAVRPVIVGRRHDESGSLHGYGS